MRKPKITRKTTRTKGSARHSCRCPKPRCRTQSRVLRTSSEDGAVVRHRICRKGHRFVTREQPTTT